MRSENYLLSERSAYSMNEVNEHRSPTNPRKNLWWSLDKSIFQGFCKPKRNAFTNDYDEEGEEDANEEWNDHFSASSVYPSITTLMTRQHSASYHYGSTQSILEIWIAACVLLGWTIRVLQYKDTSLALTTVAANKF